MTEAQTLQKELDKIMAKFSKVNFVNTATDNAPKIKRSYTYRTSPAITASDVCSL